MSSENDEAEDSFIVNSLSEISIDDLNMESTKPNTIASLNTQTTFNEFLKMQPSESPIISSPKPVVAKKPLARGNLKVKELQSKTVNRNARSSLKLPSDEFNAATYQLEIDSLSVLLKTQKKEIATFKSTASAKDREMSTLRSDVSLLEKMVEDKSLPGSLLKAGDGVGLSKTEVANLQKTIEEQEVLLKGVSVCFITVLVSNRE